MLSASALLRFSSKLTSRNGDKIALKMYQCEIFTIT